MSEREKFEKYITDEGFVEFDGYYFAVYPSSGKYEHKPTEVAWKSWQAATAQPLPQVEDHEYLIVNFGYGEIEVAEGISEDTYALILGNNGMGIVGADLQGNRLMTKQETIAVLKFYNLAAIDVVLARLDVLRERMKNNEPVEIKNNDGEVIKVVNIKLQAAQEGE